jgi:hypothetical protein
VTTDPTTPLHVPVLRDRVLALLAPAVAAPGAVLVDATLGLGGHSEALLQAFPDARLTWLTTAGGTGLVFLATAAELPKRAAAQERPRKGRA